MLWETGSETNTRYNSTPAVAGGVVYASGGAYNGNGGEGDAFNAQTGKQLWSTSTGPLNYSSPAVVNEVVYFGSGSPRGNVYALNAQTGKQLWLAPVSKSINSSPVVANGLVYVGSDKMYAFTLKPGSTLVHLVNRER